MVRRTPVAVVGAGYWGRKHVEEYMHMPEADLRIVCDPSKASREYVEQAFGVRRTTDAVEDVLDSDVEAVSVAVPNELHFATVKTLLEGGKHVLVEKPMTLTAEEGRELLGIAEANRRLVAVGHIYRFNNAMNRMRALVADRYFGNLFSLRLQWTNLEPAFPGRDVLFDLLPHSFDILHHLLGEWPTRISCHARAFRRDRLEEMAFVVAEHASGVLANVEVSWLLPGKVRTLDVIGMERSAHVECIGQKITIHESGSTFELPIERNNTLRDELSAFLRWIREGHPPLNSGEIGVRTVELIELCHRANRESRTIDVPSRS
ncbi:MAG: Gfo/Idh/MocA family protein [Methanobacteriota archaeon]